MNNQTNPLENELGLILSCQTSNDPNKWKKPAMNEKKDHKPEEIIAFILKVEDTFELPFGTLGKQNRGSHNGYSIPEIKRAAIYHFTRFSKIKPGQLAPYFGVKRTGIIYQLEEADKFLKNQDQEFNNYYSVIKSIAV